MGERLSRIVDCRCGAVVLGYVDGEPCPRCEGVILDARP